MGDPGIEPGVRLREGVTVPCHTLRPVAHFSCAEARDWRVIKPPIRWGQGEKDDELHLSRRAGQSIVRVLLFYRRIRA